MEGGVHEAGVAVVDEPGRQAGVLLVLFAALALPVELLRGLLVLALHHRGGVEAARAAVVVVVWGWKGIGGVRRAVYIAWRRCHWKLAFLEMHAYASRTWA